MLATNRSSKMKGERSKLQDTNQVREGAQDLTELEKERMKNKEKREESLNEQKKTHHLDGALKSWDCSGCGCISPG